MDSKITHQIRELIERKARSLVSPTQFELAYQVRVAVDRIRFAIKNTEQFAPPTGAMREVGLQLLDALQRLEGVERRFQERSRPENTCDNRAEFWECADANQRNGISDGHD
jgi:hypothetical protein